MARNVVVINEALRDLGVPHGEVQHKVMAPILRLLLNIDPGLIQSLQSMSV